MADRTMMIRRHSNTIVSSHWSCKTSAKRQQCTNEEQDTVKSSAEDSHCRHVMILTTRAQQARQLQLHTPMPS